MPSTEDRLLTIFSEALERPAAERAVYLDEACGTDADLRARVEALLRAHDEAGPFLGDEPEPRSLRDTTRDGHAASEGAGTIIGPYKLLELIGEGGMGAVGRCGSFTHLGQPHKRCQGHELPAEVACRPAFAKETIDRAADAVRSDMGMAALHPADQVLQTGPDLVDLHRAAFAGVFFIGAAVDKDEAARKRLARGGVGEFVLEYGDPVLFAWQGGVGVAATPLLDSSGSVSVYNKTHYVGGRYTGKMVYVSVDPLRREWLFRDAQGNQMRTQPAEQLCRERIVTLVVSDRRQRSGRTNRCRD